MTRSRDIEAALGRGVHAANAREHAEAAHRLVRRAAAEGLIDVVYATLDSPVGPLVLAATPRGLARLAYADDGPDAVLDELAQRLSPRIAELPERLDPARRELDEYFAGRRRTFDLAIDWALAPGFRRLVLEATARIPYGGTATYSEVAAAAGNARAARATGNALGANPVPIVIPCHRVLRTGGALGGYTGGLDRKRALLEVERSPSGRVVPLPRVP